METTKKFAIAVDSGAVVVTARSKKEAIEKFRNFGYKVRTKDVYRFEMWA